MYNMGQTCRFVGGVAMVRKADERVVTRTEHRFGADGYITSKKLVNSEEELNGKGRMFSHITVAPHSGIGFHMHEGDMEIYYVLSGKANYSDNGTMVEIGPGDVTFAPSGTGHAVDNPYDEPFEMVALIVYA